MDGAEIDNHVEGQRLAVVPRRVPHRFEVAVEEFVGALPALVGHGGLCAHTLHRPFERVAHGVEAEGAPWSGAIGIDGAEAEGVGREGSELVEEEAGVADGAVKLSVKLHLVVVGIVHLVPSRGEGVGLQVAPALVEHRGGERAAVNEEVFGGLEDKAFHLKR